MNQTRIRKLRKTGIVLISLIIVALALYFSVRGFILRKIIASVNTKIKSYEYVAHWDGARFRGTRTVFVKGIYIQSRENEIFIDSLSVRVSIVPLLIKRINIRKLDCRAVSIRLNEADTLDLNANKTSADSTDPFEFFNGRDIAGFAYKNIRRFFNYVPARVKFGQIELRYRYAGNLTVAQLKNFSLIRGEMNGKLNFKGNAARAPLPLQGRIDRTASILELSVSNPDSSLLPIPLLQDKYGVAGGFDSLSFMIDLSRRKKQMINMPGRFSLTGFELKGDRLSTENIRVNLFRSLFNLNVGADFIELDSSTTSFLNDIRLKPYLRFTFGDDPQIVFKLLPETWNAQDFFASLPRGMFISVAGIKAGGLLHYDLSFAVNLNDPDSLRFNTHLSGENFSIINYGIDDYRQLNRSFLHRVYEKGRVAATFLVGPENPDFVPFNEISPYVRAAVMTSEDGSFFFHNGFNSDAFRESIATNIREKSFVRGGSTISMQLVKNVFLIRNKTLARKIEEALIVWLIENKKLVSKQRMFEVYLNIIEWGPGVYGINQASYFYFDKSPGQLDLSESVYLASIVPRPKWYKYTFEANGKPRSFYENYFYRLTELMTRKAFINPSDTLGVRPAVVLKGFAANVFEDDSAGIDTVRFEELNILPVF